LELVYPYNPTTLEVKREFGMQETENERKIVILSMVYK